MRFSKLALCFIFALAAGVVSKTSSVHAIDLPAALQGATSLKPDRRKVWNITLGAGVGHRPDYMGSDDYETIPLPLIDIEYRNRLFLSTQKGLGIFLISNDTFRFGPRLSVDEGRDADDNSLTAPLDDIDPSLEIGAYGEVYARWFRLKTDIRYGITDGHEGFLAIVDAAIAVKAGRDDLLVLGANVSFADSSYMQAYFGVPADRATARLRPFQAEAGLRDFNIYGSFIHSFPGTGWFLTVDGIAGDLLGDADTSPLAQELDQALTQFYLGTVVGYRF